MKEKKTGEIQQHVTAGMQRVLEELKKMYPDDEPILIGEVVCEGMKTRYVYQQITKLALTDLLERYDTGVYFIAKKDLTEQDLQRREAAVVKEKYLLHRGERLGYVTGVAFANQLGLTTKEATAWEVVTNHAANEYREIILGRSDVILRCPRVPVNEDNYLALQLLDLIKDIDLYEALPMEELKITLSIYMNEHGLKFADLEPHLEFYPDRIYRNLFRLGLLYGRY